MFGDIAALPMGVPMPVAEIPTIEAQNMHKSDQMGDELPNSENEEGPEAKKSRSNYRIPKKATMDNDILMETLTHLNYHQLAKSCLVSKRFWNMIRAHRHKLALLYVDCIEMGCIRFNLPILEIFDKELCPEEYNEWVIRNRYSKQIPLNGQDAEKNCTRNEGEIYNLRVLAGKGLKDQSDSHVYDKTYVLFARVEHNDENWPVFQHFVRLLTDPFIYIRDLKLDLQNDVINLLAEATNPDGNRIQCKEFYFCLAGNVQKFVNWTKNNLSCEKIRICGNTVSNPDGVPKFNEELLDLFVSGSRCTSEVYTYYYKLSKCIVDLVQKFMDLECFDECEMVESIQGKSIMGYVKYVYSGNDERLADVLKRNYSEVIVKKGNGYTEQVFEFVNNGVGKKLTIAVTQSQCSLKIKNL